MTITANETTYIYPPRPTAAVPRDQTQIYAEFGWIAQFKYNDSRCMVKLRADGTIELWNRHAERFRSYNAPIQLVEQLEEIHGKLGTKEYHLLDGGLLEQKHKAIKGTIVIWDILVHKGEHLVGTTYTERYQLLQNKLSAHSDWEYAFYHSPRDRTVFTLGDKITEDTFIPTNWRPEEWNECWRIIDTINAPFLSTGEAGPLLEGLVYKDPNGTLQFGLKPDNNSTWLGRSRVKTGRHEF